MNMLHCINLLVLCSLVSIQIRAADDFPHVDDCNLCMKCHIDEEPSKKLYTIKDLMVRCCMAVTAQSQNLTTMPTGRAGRAEERLTTSSSQQPS